MKLPKSLQNVVDGFEQLPGIGPKTAQRLSFHLLRMPLDEVQKFAESLKDLKEKTVICKNCYNVGDSDLCEVCKDPLRNSQIICVVESPLDLLALEKSNFKGIYHVLHGAINPIAGIGPEEIFIGQLIDRLKGGTSVTEVILATSTSMEGEATAMYIRKQMVDSGLSSIKVSRIGKGLPIGSDIEYADENTLRDALSGRISY
jgi:recombination protein RecR